MSASLTAFPLCWPAGWPREHRRRAPKSSDPITQSFAWARDRLCAELDRLGATETILSTNVPLNISGQPRGDFRDILPDPGVAVYFRLKDKPLTMAADCFDRVSSNLHRLALALAYLRGLERHGGGVMLERAFTGFMALPDPNRRKTWHEALGIEPGVVLTVEVIEGRFRDLLLRHHPDRGGSESLMAEINVARDEALRSLTNRQATA